MSKQPVIKWSAADRAEIARLRKNYNARITRLEKAGYAPELLPSRIYAKDIKTEVKSRRDFENLKKTVQDFTARGSEKIVTYKGQNIPEFEKKRVSRMIRSVQQQKAAKRARLSEEKGNITLAKETDLRALNINKKRSDEEWKRFVKSLEAQYSDKVKLENAIKYKENYLKAIETVLGSEGEGLADFIRSQHPLDIADGYAYDETTTIRFAYDKINAKSIAKAALRSWKDYLTKKNGL